MLYRTFSIINFYTQIDDHEPENNDGNDLDESDGNRCGNNTASTSNTTTNNDATILTPLPDNVTRSPSLLLPTSPLLLPVIPIGRKKIKITDCSENEFDEATEDKNLEEEKEEENEDDNDTDYLQSMMDKSVENESSDDDDSENDALLINLEEEVRELTAHPLVDDLRYVLPQTHKCNAIFSDKSSLAFSIARKRGIKLSEAEIKYASAVQYKVPCENCTFTDIRHTDPLIDIPDLKYYEQVDQNFENLLNRIYRRACKNARYCNLPLIENFNALLKNILLCEENEAMSKHNERMYVYDKFMKSHAIDSNLLRYCLHSEMPSTERRTTDRAKTKTCI